MQWLTIIQQNTTIDNEIDNVNIKFWVRHLQTCEIWVSNNEYIDR